MTSRPSEDFVSDRFVSRPNSFNRDALKDDDDFEDIMDDSGISDVESGGSTDPEDVDNKSIITASSLGKTRL